MGPPEKWGHGGPIWWPHLWGHGMKSREMASDMTIRKMAEFRHFVDDLRCFETGKWCPEEDSNLHALASAST